jgi:hypothetical protein
MFPAIPSHLTNNIDIVTWLFKQPIPWIELDYKIETHTWLKEGLDTIPYLVEHREGEGHAGWESCCIHGLGITKTGTDMTAPLDAYHWTELSKLTPTIKKFWESFPFEHLLRVRFMSLAAGGKLIRRNSSD